MAGIKCLIYVVLTMCVVSAEICTETTCEFHLKVTNALSMHRLKPGTKPVPVEPLNQTHFTVIENLFTKYTDEIGDVVSAEDVVSVDGFERRIILVNGQFPGPSIEVMEGAEVS